MRGDALSFFDLVTVIAIGSMLLGAMGMTFYNDHRHNKAVQVFMLGSVALLASALINDAGFRREATLQIAKALVGFICAVIGALQLKGTRRDRD